MLGLAKAYMKHGLEILSRPTPIDLQEQGLRGTAWFIYVRDPDGIPVEVVEFPE